MNTARLTSPFSSSGKAACGARALAGFLMFCICLNGLVPRFSIQDNEFAALKKIMASEAVLMQFFSFSTLPLKLVEGMMAEKNAATAPVKKAPAAPSRNSANSSTDFFLVSQDTTRAVSRFVQSLRGGEFTTYVNLPAAFRTAFTIDRTGAAQENYAFLFVLIFFFLLPRSSLSEGAAVIVRSRKR